MGPLRELNSSHGGFCEVWESFFFVCLLVWRDLGGEVIPLFRLLWVQMCVCM
jgi:hypothetical protein